MCARSSKLRRMMTRSSATCKSPSAITNSRPRWPHRAPAPTGAPLPRGHPSKPARPSARRILRGRWNTCARIWLVPYRSPRRGGVRAGHGASGSAEEILASVWDALNPMAAFERASDAVGRGNQKVFQEIGFEFARFLSTCASDAAFDADKIARFCSGLRPGDPPDGQRYLRQAFGRYYQAFFEPDAQARAELCCWPTSRSDFTSRRACSPKSPRRSMRHLSTPSNSRRA